MADAKSILGLMLFTLEKDLKLVVDDGADTKALEKDIAEFLA
jgi:phosphotransferase system HPr-like phosphotransfer protein